MCKARLCIKKAVPLFPLGRVLATPRALEALSSSGVTALSLLGRHQQGDWGQLSAEDAKANSRSILLGSRILSSYEIDQRQRVWIITEADRSVTTLLLPEEY